MPTATATCPVDGCNIRGPHSHESTTGSGLVLCRCGHPIYVLQGEAEKPAECFCCRHGVAFGFRPCKN